MGHLKINKKIDLQSNKIVGIDMTIQKQYTNNLLQ